MMSYDQYMASEEALTRRGDAIAARQREILSDPGLLSDALARQEAHGRVVFDLLTGIGLFSVFPDDAAKKIIELGIALQAAADAQAEADVG